MHVEDGEFVRDAEVRVGGMCGHLLMTERHVLDPETVTRVDQRIVGVAALAEHFRDAFLLQAFGDVHRSGHTSDAPESGSTSARNVCRGTRRPPEYPPAYRWHHGRSSSPRRPASLSRSLASRQL